MSTNVLIFGIFLFIASILNYYLYGEVVDEENERVNKLFGTEKASKFFNILSGRYYSKETVKFLSMIGIVISLALIVIYITFYIYQCIKSF